MRSIFAFSLAAVLMSSCATSLNGGDSAEKAVPKREIQSLTFIESSPPVSAKLRRDQLLKIDSELNAMMEIKDGYNTVLSKKEGKISQKQFDEIAEMLNKINYVQLRPKPAKPVPGKSSETLIITSDLGAHRFVNSGASGFPEPIAEIFALKTQYLPK